MKTRIKFRMMPGDVSKHVKIQMMEEPSEERAKKWKRNYVVARERAVLHQRFRRLLREEELI